MSLTSLHQRDDCRLSRKPRGSSDLLLTTQCPLSFRKRTFDRNKYTATIALRCFPLRLTYNPQNATRFIRPLFTGKESGSCRDHVFRCLQGHVCAIAAIDRFEQGYDDVDVFVVVRISSHAASACAHGVVSATC